ncbi:hypothetical protein VTO73DRAFT_12268 [Trametes versicolor]
MHLIKTLLATFTAAAAVIASGPLLVNTPVIKDDEVVQSFRNIPETNATQTDFTWLTNIAADQQVRIQVFDGDGEVASTGLFTIQPGNAFTLGSLLLGHIHILWNAMHFIKALVAASSAAALVGGSQLLVITPVLKDNEIVESFKNIPQTNANQTDFTWLTNIAAGQQVRIEIFDQIGAVAPTGLFTIQPGSTL